MQVSVQKVAYHNVHGWLIPLLPIFFKVYEKRADNIYPYSHANYPNRLFRTAGCTGKERRETQDGLGTLTALLTFLILPNMPMHPMIIQAVFGAGICLAFMTLFLPVWMIRIYRGNVHADLQDESDHNSDELNLRQFAFLSCACAAIIFSLLLRDPRAVICPYVVFVGTLCAAVALLMVALMRGISMEEWKFDPTVRAFMLSDMLALLVILVPAPPRNLVGRNVSGCQVSSPGFHQDETILPERKPACSARPMVAGPGARSNCPLGTMLCSVWLCHLISGWIILGKHMLGPNRIGCGYLPMLATPGCAWQRRRSPARSMLF